MDPRPVDTTPDHFSQYLQLFRSAFPRSRRYTFEYLTWLYVRNPVGPPVGFDMWEGNQIIGHYACIPTYVSYHGTEVPALLSLNTATHPSYQGKGVFSRLASATYEAAKEHGVHIVYGVANQNSTPGFVRKLNFQLVSPLEASVGWGLCTREYGATPEFSVSWSMESLQWRLSSPEPGYGVVQDRQRGTQDAFRNLYPGLSVVQRLPLQLPKKSSDLGVCPKLRHGIGLQLFLGKTPRTDSSLVWSLRIPQRLRPAPLNFIFRHLQVPSERLASEGLDFGFLDFDAY